MIGSYFGLALAFRTAAGEVIALSQPVIAVICWIEKVYVADEHLRGKFIYTFKIKKQNKKAKQNLSVLLNTRQK